MIVRSVITIALAICLSACTQIEPEPVVDAEAIIIGAGISGLSAAVEMGRAGVDVLVVDMNSVPGGHAVMAGGFAIIDTPTQQRAGHTDSPDRAFEDMLYIELGSDLTKRDVPVAEIEGGCA